MKPENCVYRFQPFAGIEHYQCTCLTKVTEHGLMCLNCDPEICPVVKGITVEVPAALEPLLKYHRKQIEKLELKIDELNRRVSNLEWKQKNDEDYSH